MALLERARRYHQELYAETVLFATAEEFKELGELAISKDGEYIVVSFKVDDEPKVVDDVVLEFSNLALARSIEAAGARPQ